MSGAGGGQQQQSTSTTNNDPWAGQQPYLSSGFATAKNWLNGGAQPGVSSYTGPTPQQIEAQYMPQIADATHNMSWDSVSSLEQQMAKKMAMARSAGASPSSQVGPGFTPAELQAQGNVIGMANSGANGMYPASARSLTGFMNGDMLNSNPYLDKMANAADNSIVRNYQTAVAPGVDSALARFGRYGSGAMENAKSQAQQDLAEQLGNTNAGIYGQAYQQGMQNMLQASALAPQAANLGLGLAQAENTVGATQRNLPINNLKDYMSLIQGNYGGTTTQSTPYYTNPYAGAAGGALAGYEMAGGSKNPYAGYGALAGGLMGYFGAR